MVRGWHAERLLQLRRPSPCQARRPDRHPVGRRRSEGRQETHLQTIARRGLPFRQRAESARRQEGRPRHHLHADDSGGGGLHPRLRAHWRGPFGDIRRLFTGLDCRTYRRLQIDGGRDRRRRRSRRPQDSTEGQCRRRLRQGWRRGNRDRRQADQRGRQHESRARRLLRRDRQRRCRPTARARR